MVKIRPWPFDKRIVKLHWLGNVKMINNQWIIQVAFVDGSNCTFIELPIGALPMLKIGIPYKEGVPLYTQKEGSIYETIVQDLGVGSNTKAIDICRKFNYYLHKRPELMRQNMWSFTSENLTYHIPHTELIRSLYTPNKTLANTLLRPNGLDLLVNKAYAMNKQTAFIDFSDEIPSSIMNNDFARYMGWLYLNRSINNSFSSVQSNAYAFSINNSTNYGIPLKLHVPNSEEIRLAIRGVKIANEVLVFEIIGIDIADFPFPLLCYKHKGNKKYVQTKHPKKKRLSIQEKDQEFILNEKNGVRSKVDTHQPAIDLEPTQFAFRNLPIVKRIPKQEQKVNQGDEYISNVGRGGGVKQQIVGLDDSVFGGKITPLEFKSMEVVSFINNYGLENFIKMINYLSIQNNHLEVSVNFVFLPLGRTFSYLPDGRRRICAVAKINNQGGIKYIIEISVPDNRSLSTIIISTNGILEEDENCIYELLEKLILNSGRWNKVYLEKFSHYRIRHQQESPEKWAYRLQTQFVN